MGPPLNSTVDRGVITIGISAVLIISLLLIGGWIWNAVKLIGMLDGDITAMFIARVAGVFIPPFGGLLGFF